MTEGFVSRVTTTFTIAVQTTSATRLYTGSTVGAPRLLVHLHARVGHVSWVNAVIGTVTAGMCVLTLVGLGLRTILAQRTVHARWRTSTLTLYRTVLVGVLEADTSTDGVTPPPAAALVAIPGGSRNARGIIRMLHVTLSLGHIGCARFCCIFRLFFYF